MKQYKRILDKKAFKGTNFLLGPRKTGKSTYLKVAFPDSLYIDLLDNAIFHDFNRSPGKMYEMIQYQIGNSDEYRQHPIIIDEIQRIPSLINDVHRLIEEEKLDFILCGSSARKLVRGGANMLGGRAGRITMGGLSIVEIDDFDLLRFMNNGSIPSHYLSEEPNQTIKAYLQNYIQEEIKGEALVRNLSNFNRFIDLVGLTNGEEVNFTNISQDIGVDSKTIKEYYQILVDTLIGNYIEPYFDKEKRSHILKSPKFYLFDVGLANFIKGISLSKDEGTEFGKSFEQVILNEITSYKSYRNKNFKISFWRTYEKDKVDLILGDAEVAIEVKGRKNIKERMLGGLLKFNEIYKPRKSIVVANITLPHKLDSGIEVVPYMEFVKLLWNGDII